MESAAPTLAVLSQTFYHFWQAEVDGQATPVLRANYAFQAVEVPAGKHRVVLRYQDGAFFKGLVITVVALLICGAGWWVSRGAPKPAAGAKKSSR